jgi:hypothetical protein
MSLSKIENLAHEPHVFRLTQSFRATGGTTIVIVSMDGSIVHLLEDDAYWNGEFQSGEHRIYVEGHWNLLDNNIYLGHRVTGHDW